MTMTIVKSMSLLYYHILQMHPNIQRHVSPGLFIILYTRLTHITNILQFMCPKSFIVWFYLSPVNAGGSLIFPRRYLCCSFVRF